MLRHPAALLSPLTLALLLHGLPALADDEKVEAPPVAASEAEVRPAPPRPMLDSRSESHQQALQRQLPQRQQLMLDGGADPFLSLWLPANQAQPAGLVVLLHGEGETADWPTAIGPLRRQLPDLGWSTLSLSLPDAPPSGVQSRKARPVTVVLEGVEKSEPGQASEAPNGEPEQASAQLTEPADVPPGAGAESHPVVLDELAPAEPDHERRLLARVRAALEHARQHNPRTLVLLGHGTGAYWAARFLHQEQPAEVSQLVMVSAREPDAVATPLDELLPQLRLATGDFYYRDQPAQHQDARERLNASKRQEHPAYLQIGLPSLPSDARAEQEQLVRRVRGWLQLEPRAAQR